MAQMRSVTFKYAALAILVMVVAGSCKRENRDGRGALTGSLLFDNASPDMREALASSVDFRINDDNFARWEEAQRNLERLPRSAIPTGSAAGRSAIDRAVGRLESSPYARTAIERAGLSVREFVLATIALAQATEAAQTGKTLSQAPIPAENFQFVQRYTARALYSRSRVARGEAQNHDWDADEADGNNNQVEMDMQMRLEEAEHRAEMRLAELEMRREEVERAAELQREEAERAAEQQREEQERAAELQREETERAAEMQREAVDQQAERLRAQRERDSTRRRRQ